MSELREQFVEAVKARRTCRATTRTTGSMRECPGDNLRIYWSRNAGINLLVPVLQHGQSAQTTVTILETRKQKSVNGKAIDKMAKLTKQRKEAAESTTEKSRGGNCTQ